MTANKEIVNLLKDIKKRNDTIIKSLKSIDNGVCEANGYIIKDGEDKMHSPEDRYQDKIEKRLKEYGLDDWTLNEVNGYKFYDIFSSINRLICFRLGLSYPKKTEEEYQKAVKLLDEILPPKEGDD